MDKTVWALLIAPDFRKTLPLSTVLCLHRKAHCQLHNVHLARSQLSIYNIFTGLYNNLACKTVTKVNGFSYEIEHNLNQIILTVTNWFIHNWRLPNDNQVTTRLSSLGKWQTKVLDIFSQFLFLLRMPAQWQKLVYIPP